MSGYSRKRCRWGRGSAEEKLQGGWGFDDCLNLGVKSPESESELPDVTLEEKENDSARAQIQAPRKQANGRVKPDMRGKQHRSSLNTGLWENSIMLKSGAANPAQPQDINTAHKVTEQKMDKCDQGLPYSYWGPEASS